MKTTRLFQFPTVVVSSKTDVFNKITKTQSRQSVFITGIVWSITAALICEWGVGCQTSIQITNILL